MFNEQSPDKSGILLNNCLFRWFALWSENSITIYGENKFWFPLNYSHKWPGQQLTKKTFIPHLIRTSQFLHSWTRSPFNDRKTFQCGKPSLMSSQKRLNIVSFIYFCNAFGPQWSKVPFHNSIPETMFLSELLALQSAYSLSCLCWLNACSSSSKK